MRAPCLPLLDFVHTVLVCAVKIEGMTAMSLFTYVAAVSAATCVASAPINPVEAT